MGHISNISAEQSEFIFNAINDNLEKLSNSQYLATMTKYAGYLTFQQRVDLAKRYAKIDGDRQIRYMEENKKLREEYYEKNIKTKIDPSLPINSQYNMMKAKKAAEEENKLKELERVFYEAKDMAKNTTIKIEESNDPRKNLVNIRAKNVIVKYQDGTISHINEEVEKRAIEAYKNQLHQQRQNTSYDVDNDDEYS